jgi:preprotein translocase subunit SecG
MYALLVSLHILVAFIMVAVILLQAGKGAEIGAAFGGSSQTIFGSRGAATFLSKVTAVAATVFMLTSLALSFAVRERSVASTVIDLQQGQPPAQAPGAPPAAEGQPAPEAGATPPAAPAPPAPPAATPAK